MTRTLHRAGLAALLWLGLGLAAARPAAAQVDTTTADTTATESSGGARYAVSVFSGYQWFDESAALRNAPLLGLAFTRPVFGRVLSLGANVAFMRPQSRGDYFPWNRQVYFSDAAGTRDTTLLFVVSQNTTVATYGLEAGARAPLGRLGVPAGRLGGIELGAHLGAGLWTLWTDPEQNHRSRAHGGWTWSYGASLGIPVGGASSIQLQLDDVVINHFYRGMLSLSDPLFAEDLFTNPETAVPAARTSFHNPRLSVGFAFVPGKGAP